MATNNYNKLRKKYGLPDPKKFAEALEIEVKTDQDPILLLQNLRNEVAEKLYDLMKIMETILFTSEGSDAGLLYQEQMIKAIAKDGFELYKTFNQLNYSGLRLRFEHDRKKDADFIKKVFSMWPAVEKRLASFFSVIEKGWEDLDISKEVKPENYHG